MQRIKVLFLVGTASSTAVPVEVASHLDVTQVDLTVVTYYDSPSYQHHFPVRLSSIGARRAIDIRAWKTLHGLIRSNQPDVIHVNHTVPAAVGSFLGRISRVPVLVVTEHHDHRDLSPVSILANFATQNLVDAIICNSKYTCDSFYWWERVISGHKCTAIYNGIDIDAIDRAAHLGSEATIRKHFGFSDSEIVIGNVGRLVREKNQETLVRAVSIALRANPRIRLMIVGEGPLRSRLETLVEELNLTRNVTFTGELERHDVYQLLQIFDIFVMTSTTEGFCNAVVEAMAASKPVVATPCGALPEVIGQHGWIVADHSPESVAHAVQLVSTLSADELKKVTSGARQRAQSQFTVQKTAAEYFALYRQHLGESGSS